MSFWNKKRRASKTKKVLTLTYYIEPRNLRMLTISVAKLKAVLAAIAVLTIWGIVSIGLMLASEFSNYSNDIAKSSLTSVGSIPRLAAETTNVPSQDILIETQNSEAKVDFAAVGDTATLPSENKEEGATENGVYNYDKVLDAKIAKVYDDDKAKTLKSDLQNLSKESIFALPEQAQIKSETLDLEEVNWIQKNNELDVKFAIKYSGEGRARGSVYGVADFILENGSKMQVLSHEGINPDLLRANKHLGTMFGAKKLTYKKLKFRAPKDAKGTFANLKVIMNEENHKHPLIHAEKVR